MRQIPLTLVCIGLVSLLSLAPSAFGSSPAWWVTRGVLNTNVTANDYSAVNQGQIKNIASQARAEMDADLTGGAGSNVVALINSFSTTNNYLAVNNGQLKNVAKPFYDRLIAVGYTNAYPWTATSADDNDYAIANIGQLKNLFSWDLATWLTLDSDGDGLPNGWEVAYGLNPHDSGDANQSSAHPFAHGLTNLQVYQNPSVLIADNYSTLGDGIPDWWKVKYGFSLTDTGVANGDPDNDNFSNLAEFLAGTSPVDVNDHSFYSFTVNGGGLAVSNAQLRLDFPVSWVADYVVISEWVTMANSVTNSFISPLSYTLMNTNDGLHTIYLQSLKASGALSPIIAYSFELDTHPPTISITSPTNAAVTAKRRVNIQGFAADAATNAPALDASRPLQVTVNGDFVNDRGTNGAWWAGPQDLVPGTNTFTVVATDRAGFSVTNSVWFIYDPTLATNVPTFSVDVTNAVVVVGSNTTSYALSGSIDDDNATVEIAVVDATDETITNATVNAAVHGTNWWAEVPVLAGSNAVVVIAKNSASLPARSGFTAVQDPNVFLEITSPAANTAVNASNVTVTGRASTNFNGTITVNGRPALVTPGSGEWIFNAAAPISRVDANVIEVHAEGSDGSSASVRQIVFGYEMLSGRLEWGWFWTHSQDDCFYARHYPHQHRWRDDVYEIDWWDETRLSYAYQSHEYSYSGVLLGSSQGSGSFDYSHDSVPFWFDSGGDVFAKRSIPARGCQPVHLRL